MSKQVTLPKSGGRAKNDGSLGPGAMLFTVILGCPLDLTVGHRMANSTGERSGSGGYLA